MTEAGHTPTIESKGHHIPLPMQMQIEFDSEMSKLRSKCQGIYTGRLGDSEPGGCQLELVCVSVRAATGHPRTQLNMHMCVSM